VIPPLSRPTPRFSSTPYGSRGFEVLLLDFCVIVSVCIYCTLIYLHVSCDTAPTMRSILSFIPFSNKIFAFTNQDLLAICFVWSRSEMDIDSKFLSMVLSWWYSLYHLSILFFIICHFYCM
jgi:hypothetical protein